MTAAQPVRIQCRSAIDLIRVTSKHFNLEYVVGRLIAKTNGGRKNGMCCFALPLITFIFLPSPRNSFSQRWHSPSQKLYDVQVISPKNGKENDVTLCLRCMALF